MSDMTRDALLNARLKHRVPGREFLTDESMRWGELVLPAPNERRERPIEGAKLVCFASFHIGYLVLRAAQLLEDLCPGLVSIVGVVTDDPVNTDARIGMKKRYWHLLPTPVHLDRETALVEAGLERGVPVFTGDTKSDWFHQKLREWNPDAIVVCGFGQLIDPAVLAVPQLGVNNIHPSNLAAGVGAGLAPFDDVLARGDRTTNWTVHLMDNDFDTGPVLGTSAPINVSQADGALFETPLQYMEKVLCGLDYMVVSIVVQLATAHGAGATAPLSRIDIDTVLPNAVKAKMMEPVDITADPNARPSPDREGIEAWLPSLMRAINGP
ncbi:MAG: formyltransferase family protein [Devosia sp.]